MIKRKHNKGFTLIEIVVVIAIMVVLLAILTPSILRYTETSRMQKDDSAMDELCGTFQLALADSTIFDEAFSYSITNNYVTYTDSSGNYGTTIVDEEFWAPDGSGHAVTITWNPDESGNYIIAEGIVNDMTYGNGSVADSRVSNNVQQCYLSEMGTGKLYHQVEQTFGSTFSEKSATYKNSSYTVFIRFNLVDGIYRPTIYGSFNGTNLSPDCPASLGSGTSSYTETEEPEQTKTGGTTQSNFTSSDLQGSGGGGTSSNPTYKQDVLPCGHKPSTPGNHEELPCGHYACRCDCEPAPCGIEGHLTGDGMNHEKLECGHFGCQCSGCIIPAGGQYTTVDGTVYGPGDSFPAMVTTGDKYTYGDYEYRYNQYNQVNWNVNESQNGWGVRVLSGSKSSYGEILSTINNKNVTCMRWTFGNCGNLKVSPAIPQTVKDMTFTYSWCTSLITPAAIPNSVTKMEGTFFKCSALKTAPDIPSSVTDMTRTFDECSSLETAPTIIPSSVQIMDSTFASCINLQTAPAIPSSVIDMDRTFYNCRKLSGVVVINANPSSRGSCFSVSAASNDIVLTGESTQLITFARSTNATYRTKTDVQKIVGQVSDGDFHIEGSYEYTYKQSLNGWEVKCAKSSAAPEAFHGYVNSKPVVSMKQAYNSCSSMVTAPSIPNTITDMSFAYSWCRGLTSVPEIPNSVTNMEGTFFMCTALQTVPEIPTSVTKANRVFDSCSGLITAPVLHQGITTIDSAFSGCTSLTGEVVINTNTTSYSRCFNNVDFTTQNITLTGSSTKLDVFGKTGKNYCDTCDGTCKNNH